MAIKVKDIDNVLVDGVAAGQVSDVMANYPARRPELQAALVAHREEQRTKNQTDRRAAVDAANAAGAQTCAQEVVAAEERAALQLTQIQADHARVVEGHVAQLATAEHSLATQLAALQTTHDTTVADIQVEHAAAVAQLEGRIAVHKERIAKLDEKVVTLQEDLQKKQALIDAMGGTPLGKQLRREAQRVAAEAAKAAAEKALADLAAEEVVP